MSGRPLSTTRATATFQPDRELVALVGRGVGHQQDFAAGLERCTRPGPAPRCPRRSARRCARRLNDDRPRRRAGAEHPLLVEHAVIRQIDLEPHRLDAPAVEQRDGVVERAVLDPRQADQHRRAAVGGLARQRLAGGAARLLEGGLQHQVLGRIAGEKQLRRQHDVRAERRRPRRALRAAASRLPSMSPTIGGDLRERDDEAVGGCGHGGICGATARSANAPLGMPAPEPLTRVAIGGRCGVEANTTISGLVAEAPREPRQRYFTLKRYLPRSGSRGRRYKQRTTAKSGDDAGPTPPPGPAAPAAARRSLLSSSATRKAISIACSALSRGSQ